MHIKLSKSQPLLHILHLFCLFILPACTITLLPQGSDNQLSSPGNLNVPASQTAFNEGLQKTAGIRAFYKLAYIGNDGNVYVALVNSDGDLKQSVQVTTDATTFMEGPGRSYHRLAWSRDGRLAYAAMKRTTETVKGELFVASSTVEGGSLAISQPTPVWTGDTSYVIYLYWSPNICAEETLCSHLAFLDATEETMGLNLIRKVPQSEPHAISAQRLGSGRPFYFGWSADGEDLLWHVNGSAQYSSDAAIVHYSLKKNIAQSLDLYAGSFLAPALSPMGPKWLGVTLDDTRLDVDTSAESSGGELHIFDGVTAHATNSTRLVNVPISSQFTWDPNGRFVAYANRRQVDSGRFGPISLYDSQTTISKPITPPSRNVLGFFWSPSGNHLAYIHDLGSPDPRWSQWRIVSANGSQDRGFAPFRAGFGMRFMLGSFSQYAQSHQYWSPDGRHLLMVDEDNSFVTRVWLVDTEDASTAKPKLIADGSLAVWDWQ